jgi:hypothetical protein
MDVLITAWGDEDWQTVNHWLPEDVKARAAEMDKSHDLDALFALCNEMHPGYLDADQF